MAALIPAKPPPRMTTLLRLAPFRVAAASAIVRAPLFNSAAGYSLHMIVQQRAPSAYPLFVFLLLLDAPIWPGFRSQKLVHNARAVFRESKTQSPGCLWQRLDLLSRRLLQVAVALSSTGRWYRRSERIASKPGRAGWGNGLDRDREAARHPLSDRFERRRPPRDETLRR